MVQVAPRYDPRIVAAVRRLDDEKLPIAETCRRVGAAAGELGLPRPSYVHLRRLVLLERELRAERRAVREEIATQLLKGRLPHPDGLDRARGVDRPRR